MFQVFLQKYNLLKDVEESVLEKIFKIGVEELMNLKNWDRKVLNKRIQTIIDDIECAKKIKEISIADHLRISFLKD